MTSHIYAAIPHTPLLTSPTAPILSTSERTNKCTHIFIIKEIENVLRKQRPISQIQLLSPYMKSFTTTAFLPTVSYVFIRGLFDETLNQSVYTTSNGRTISEHRIDKYK